MNRLFKIFVSLVVMAFAAATNIVGDSTDINDKLIATTIAVDKKDGDIWFYVEFANIEASKGSSGSSLNGSAHQYYMVKAKGKTFVEVRENLNRQLDKPLYMGGVRTLLISQRFAEEDLVEYIYRLRADETYRKKIITITTFDDLDVLFKTLNDKDKSVGYMVESTIKQLDNSGQCSLRTTSRLLENLSDAYGGILMPCIALQDAQIAFTGYTVIRDTKAVGFIPIAQCDGLNMIKVNHAKTFYVVPYQDQELSVETICQGKKIDVSFQDGRAHFTFTLKYDANLEYGTQKTPYGLTKEDMRALRSIIEQMILGDLYTAFDQAQNIYQTDYLQCDDAFRVKYPVLFASSDWHDAFAQAEINATISVNFSTMHMIDYGDSVVR